MTSVLFIVIAEYGILSSYAPRVFKAPLGGRHWNFAKISSIAKTRVIELWHAEEGTMMC